MMTELVPSAGSVWDLACLPSHGGEREKRRSGRGQFHCGGDVVEWAVTWNVKSLFAVDDRLEIIWVMQVVGGEKKPVVRS